MWLGGNGTSKYIPLFGYKPTNYQKSANALFLENFGGQRLEERIINETQVDYSLMKTGDLLFARRFSG
jgi:hypothetical protein